MRTIIVTCPSCKTTYSVFEDAQHVICSKCNFLKFPTQNASPAPEPVKPNVLTDASTNAITQPKAPVKKESMVPEVLWGIFIVIAAFVGIMAGIEQFSKKADIASADTTKIVNVPTLPKKEVYEDNSMSRYMHLPTDNSNNNQEVTGNNQPIDQPATGTCTLRIINTFQGTDKSQRGNISMNEATRTLTFKGTEHPGEDFEMIAGQSSQCLMKMYINGQLEAEKVVYRKSALETGDGALIYTSRTGEIRMIFSCDR